MLKRLFILYLSAFSPALYAQKYNYNAIPDSLTKNAKVVKRFQETIFEIKSPGEGVLREHVVYTILNEAGESYANYNSRYDKFNSINSISGMLYNASGKEIKHVKKKDMQDVSGTGDESLITDSRYKVHDFYYKEYPFTIEYEEEDNMNGILGFPDWQPQDEAGVAVEYSKYVLIAPSNYLVRFKELNLHTPPVITETKDKKTYTWEIRNLPAQIPEKYSPSWASMTPRVMLAPSEFEAEGYKGDMSTWESYGKFIYQLVRGRDMLPDEIKANVHQLTDAIREPKQKIAVLYDFLQKNTRYVSVQLGIGGWQPFDASYVAAKRYGDCKALSNYMVALLKEAGITGKYVEIRARNNAAAIVTDFPESQFNHVICCVPLDKDTVWLECTSETLPAGYLSGFTSDRYGLLIDESGGKLVHTPKYGLSDNLQTRNIDATVDAEGNLSANIHTSYKAWQQDDLEEMIASLSKDQQLKYLKSSIRLPTYDVVKFEYRQEKQTIPIIREDLELVAPNYSQTSGRRLFINPNVLNRNSTRLETSEQRKCDISFSNEFRDIDSVVIKIPPGFVTESIPKEMKIENQFGKYATSTKVQPDKIIYYRLSEQYRGQFPPKDYPDLVKYYEQMYKSDQSQVVLVKKE